MFVLLGAGHSHAQDTGLPAGSGTAPLSQSQQSTRASDSLSDSHTLGPTQTGSAVSTANTDNVTWLPHMSGLIQVDSVLFHQSSVDQLDPSTGEPLNENRFVLRRARLTTDVSRGVMHGYVSIEANSQAEPTLRVQAAEVALQDPKGNTDGVSPWIMVSAGLSPIPLSHGLLERDETRLFFEPPIWVGAMFPGRRDLMARARAGYRFLRAELAVMNGEPALTAVPVHDKNAAKDVLGRITVTGDVARNVNVSMSGALLLGTGFHSGRLQSKDTLTWNDENQDNFVQTTELAVVAGAAAEPSRNFSRHAIAGDIQLAARLPVLGEMHANGEVVFAENMDRNLFPADPVSQGRDMRELGVAVSLQQHITRFAELGVRFDYYDPDFDANEREGVALVPYDASFTTWTFTGAIYVAPGGRIAFEYNRRQNPLGRDDNGAPTTLASDSFSVRAQMSF